MQFWHMLKMEAQCALIALSLAHVKYPSAVPKQGCLALHSLFSSLLWNYSGASHLNWGIVTLKHWPSLYTLSILSYLTLLDKIRLSNTVYPQVVLFSDNHYHTHTHTPPHHSI